MAEGTTSTGLEEFKAAARAFPEEHRKALRAVAQATATRVEARAIANMQASKYPAQARTVIIATEEDAANQAFTVIAKPAPRRPGNITLWIEHGTLRVPAQPFMRPAAQAETAQYRR